MLFNNNAKLIKIGIRGIVVNKTNNTILLESNTSDSNVDKASISITNKTVIKKVVDGIYSKASIEDILLSDEVSVIFTGPIRESYPIQVDAKEIVIFKNNNIARKTEVGVIEKIEPSKEYGTIYIKREGYEAYVTIDENTLITKTPLSRTFSFNELKIGDKVEVEVPDILDMIYPYNYTTTMVTILDEVNETEEKNNELYMEIDTDTITPTSLTYKIYNNTDKQLNYGVAYEIQPNINGIWGEYQIEVSWIKIGVILNQNSNNEEKIDWTNIYGKLSKGIYRLVKHVDNKILTAEFDIK